MVVIRFSVLFDEIRWGKKRQTIRPAHMYKHLKPGDKVHCYSTKKVEGVRRPITDKLLFEGICAEVQIKKWGTIKRNEKIAQADGFFTAAEMEEWFNYKYPNLKDSAKFRIIKWMGVPNVA